MRLELIRWLFFIRLCEQSLFYLFPSYTEKTGSAQILFILWSRRSPSSWASHSGLLSSNWFFMRKHQFLGETDDRNWALRKQVKMAAKGPAKGNEHRFGLGSKLLLSNALSMLNKNLTGFVQSLFSVQSICTVRKGSASRVPFLVKMVYIVSYPDDQSRIKVVARN